MTEGTAGSRPILTQFSINVLKPVLEFAGWSANGVWEDGLLGGAGTGILVRQNPLATNLPGREFLEDLNRQNIESAIRT